jgi:hypothetical protein
MPIRLREADNSLAVRPIGNSVPDYKWGLSNNLTWKGLSVYGLVDAQRGGSIYNSTRQSLYQNSRHLDNDQFGKPLSQKKTPGYYNALYSTDDPVDYFVEDASFVKLREVALRYSFGQTQAGFLRRIGSDRVTLGLIGRNLYTWTSYSGMDPEVGSILRRRDDFGYPTYRTITGMLEVIF